jgi:hypothetical protein
LILLLIFTVTHPKLQWHVVLEIQPKESPMEPGPLRMVADKGQWVFSAALLNACGTDGQFGRRMRTMTPLRLGLALTATCARQRVETVADLHGGFPALFGTPITRPSITQGPSPPLPILPAR